MAEIIWTKKALNQFERAIKYIREEQGQSYANIVSNKIIESTSLLESFPNMGKTEPLLSHKNGDYRFIIVWSFKIIYRLEPDLVIISRLFHTSRDPKRLKGI